MIRAIAVLAFTLALAAIRVGTAPGPASSPGEVDAPRGARYVGMRDGRPVYEAASRRYRFEVY